MGFNVLLDLVFPVTRNEKRLVLQTFGRLARASQFLCNFAVYASQRSKIQFQNLSVIILVDVHAVIDQVSGRMRSKMP